MRPPPPKQTHLDAIEVAVFEVAIHEAARHPLAPSEAQALAEKVLEHKHRDARGDGARVHQQQPLEVLRSVCPRPNTPKHPELRESQPQTRP